MSQLESVSRRYRDPFQFSWRIPECGFRFETCNLVIDEIVREEKVRCLVHAADATRYKWERPFEVHTALFKEFATVALDEASIVKFANAFGWLEGKEFVSQHGRLIGGDRLESWFSEIREMRRLVGLWDRLQAEDMDYLRKRFIYQKESVQVMLDDWKDTVARREHRDFDELQDDVLWTALYYVGTRINKKLDEHHVTARLMKDRNLDRELTIFINPSSLISGLWFQFARAVEKNRQYRRCEWCKMPFAVGGAGGKRSDSKFCKPSHRAAAAVEKNPLKRKRTRSTTRRHKK